MRVCVVGAGGREHALAVAIARTATVVVAPGNPGMTLLSGGDNLRCTPEQPEHVDADLWVIGPEVPLVDGLADRLRAAGKLVLGPGADGARLEGSKAWMKDVLVSAGVPTAAHASFEQAEPAIDYLRRLGGGPYVVKTDGLAAGKGVLVTESRSEAIDDIRAKLSGSSFGLAGRRVVIEEGLVGDELSVMAICDGNTAVALAPAQDFKRAGDGDTGPNTGGMGAFSPVPLAGDDLVAAVMEQAVLPTLSALRRRGIDYRGVLYAGIMLTAEGPKVLEFNVRLGDPETQVVLPRWQGDVAAVLASAASGRLASAGQPTFDDQAAVCVVLAAAGYPASPRLGDAISGLDRAGSMEGVQIYASGTTTAGPDGRGRLVAGGGRVLGITGLGPSLAQARNRAYAAAACVEWTGRQYRHDIAERAAAAATAAATAGMEAGA
ncbi:MAG: phosphoribosylamine--glycine ligase [Actinomycetota bacterium]|nr:phosphoribosylamine--glycine ligase [Actinomycetota bacterium]